MKTPANVYAVAPNGVAFFPFPDTPLTRLVDKGSTVKFANRGVVVARLAREGSLYVMRNTGGAHCLAVAATDEARLVAHWEGFRETSLAISEGRIWKGM